MPAALNTYQQWIEKEIQRTRFGKQPDSLYEPIRYLMSLGGKRMRPLLVLLGYSLFRNNPKSVVRYAVAVEAFHNFTLMHDDIMDKAPLRRGKPTVHKKWNVNTAILSGDVMLVKVYEQFAQLPADILPQVLKAFNTCAAEVCEGQQWDMEFEGRRMVSEKEYIDMIRLKTAVLLGFSLELGAMLAGATAEERQSVRKFGVNMGIGFQLKDDLLDAYGDPEKFGKQVGGDILANKKTYLLIQALERASGKNKKELQQWLAATRFNKKEKVEGVKKIFSDLEIPSLTERKANTFFKKAFLDLDKLPASEARETLRSFTEYLIARQH
jgi:geranylgeranyl diphosphate synthase type II